MLKSNSIYKNKLNLSYNIQNSVRRKDFAPLESKQQIKSIICSTYFSSSIVEVAFKVRQT